MGPEQRHNGLRYLLVITDAFSGWVEAVPTRREDAASVIKTLINIQIPRHGFPELIRSDNGSHFKNEDLQKVERVFGIKHKFGSVYHPQSQGAVERVNQTIKTKLAKMMSSTGLSWVDALPVVLWDIRNSPKEVLGGLTPQQIQTGRASSSPVAKPTPGECEQLPDVVSPGYWTALTSVLASHRIYRRQCQRKADQEREEPGEVPPYVFLRRYKRKWNEARWSGPHKVSESTSHSVRLEGLGNTWYHLNQCAPAEAPPRELQDLTPDDSPEARDPGVHPDDVTPEPEDIRS